MPRASKRFISPGIVVPGAVLRDLNPTSSLDLPTAAKLSKAAYKRNQPVDGFNIDPRFSDRNKTTYVRTHPDGRKEAIIAHSGTRLSGGASNAFRDLTNNSLLALGLKRLSSRFQGGLKTTKQVMQEYGDNNVSSVGHSAGGAIALHSHNELRAPGDADGHRVIAISPGISPLDVKRSHYLLNAASHLAPLYSATADKPLRLGHAAEIHVVRKDTIASLAPFVQGNVTVHDKKPGVRDPHSIDNFT